MKYFTSILVSALLFTNCLVFAEGDDNYRILLNADIATGANIEGLRWKIDIVSTNRKGKVDEQSMLIQAVDDKWVAETLSPLRARGQKMLMINRNMWFSKPGLRKPVPISMRQRLSGGASNGDVASTNYAGDYAATRLADDTVEGELCYVFDLVAKEKSVTYDQVKYWVSQQSGIGIKANFYSRSGKHLKSASFVHDNNIDVDGQSRLFISAMEIVDELTGNRSTFTYSDIQVSPVPATAFRL